MPSSMVTGNPQRLSSLYHKQLAMGAKFVLDKNGWIRPERFTDPNDEKNNTERGIGIYDISHLTKLNVTGNDIAATISGLFDHPSIMGTLLVNGPSTFNEAICAILSNDEAFFVTNSSEAVSKLNAGIGKYQTTEVSSVLGGLYIVGDKSMALLSKLTELDVNPEAFRNLRATYAPLHHVQCIVLRFDLRDLAGYQIYFERAYGEYLWDIIFHAGREFDAIPIGSSSTALLGWRLE